MPAKWTNNYPLYWINLDRDVQRRHRMEWALKKGGWQSERWRAIDARDNQHHFLALPKPWQTASRMPGVQHSEESNPGRLTSRSELACLSSWQTLIEKLDYCSSPSGWFLLMEDDVGSSLACPEAWPASLDQLIDAAGSECLGIQLAAISSKARQSLHAKWKTANQKIIVVPKESIRSHGNGAILLNQRAIPYLKRRLGRWLQNMVPNLYVLGHPHNVRPVADKWLYASLPSSTCWVATYPLFCLDASESSLHEEHVKDFHQPSLESTLTLWKEDDAKELINNFKYWRSIKK